MSPITVETLVNVLPEKAWEFFTKPEHITGWNFASDDWHAPKATNDLRVGGTFTCRMESKDGAQGFDFSGTYEEVVLHEHIRYVMEDGRKVSVLFKNEGGKTRVTETFDPETENPPEMQKGGWQSILDNFKKYAEAH